MFPEGSSYTTSTFLFCPSRVSVKLGELDIDWTAVTSGLNRCTETQILQGSVERKVRVFQAATRQMCMGFAHPTVFQDEAKVKTGAWAKVSRKLYPCFRPISHPLSQDTKKNFFFIFLIFFVLNFFTVLNAAFPSPCRQGQKWVRTAPRGNCSQSDTNSLSNTIYCWLLNNEGFGGLNPEQWKIQV